MMFSRPLRARAWGRDEERHEGEARRRERTQPWLACRMKSRACPSSVSIHAWRAHTAAPRAWGARRRPTPHPSHSAASPPPPAVYFPACLPWFPRTKLTNSLVPTNDLRPRSAQQQLQLPQPRGRRSAREQRRRARFRENTRAPSRCEGARNKRAPSAPAPRPVARRPPAPAPSCSPTWRPSRAAAARAGQSSRTPAPLEPLTLCAAGGATTAQRTGGPRHMACPISTG